MTLDREDAIGRARGARADVLVMDGASSRGTALRKPAAILAIASTLPAVLVASWVLAGLVLVSLHIYRPAPAIVLGLGVFALLGRPALRAAIARARDLPAVPWWSLIAVLAVVVGFGVLAYATSATDVVVRRDPGSYALSSLWLAHHGTIEMPTHAAAFGGPSSDLVLWSQGFYQQGSHIVPQFMTGVPILMAVGGWIAGLSGIFHANAILGALALLAFAGLVARLIGPGWAPLATLTLAFAQPQLDVMRATYSEPAAQLILLGGLVLLVDAVAVGRIWPVVGPDATVATSQQTRDFRRALLVAGVVLGSVSVVRIDAIADLLPIVPFLGWLAFHRERAWKHLAIGVAIGLAAGALDSVLLTMPYVKYVGGSVAKAGLGFVVAIALTIVVVRAAWASRIERYRRPTFWPEIGLVVGLLMSAVVAIVLPAIRTKWHVLVGLGLAFCVVTGWVVTRAVWWGQAHYDRERSAKWPGLATLGVFLLGLFFFLRPYLMTMRSGANSGGAYYVAEVQRLRGLPIDPTRSYYEDAARWMSWYVGWATLALALAGAMWLAYEQVKGRRREWLPVFLVFVGMTAAVLAIPSITPDHPWADRRFVPVAYPAVCALAFVSVAWAFRRLARIRWQADTIWATRSVLVAASIAVIVVPAWWGSHAVFTAQTEKGEVELTNSICEKLQPDDAVVAFGAAGTSVWPGTVRVMCGVGVGRVGGTPDQQEAALTRIADASQARGGRLMILVDGTVTGDRTLVPGKVAWQPALQLDTTEVAHTLVERPDDVQHGLKFEVWIGQWQGASS